MALLRTLPVEVVDHIFSFLVPHQDILIASSRDPVLSPIVERHRYHYIAVHIGFRWIRNPLMIDSDHLCKLVSENPRILNHVRILNMNIQGPCQHCVHEPLEAFAKILLRFQQLECIVLTGSSCDETLWSDGFRAALADRLNTSTVKEVCVIGGHNFTLSVLDDCKNIENLSLSGGFVPENRVPISTKPRMKVLTLASALASPSLLTWLKPHICELQSLRSSLSSPPVLSQLLGACTQSLNLLDIDLLEGEYLSKYSLQTGEVETRPVPGFPPVPNLRHLTLRTTVSDDECCYSSFPMAAEIVDCFKCSLHHLVLDIDIHFRDLSRIDFSPLAVTVLGAASELVSIRSIDLYVHTENFWPNVTQAQFLSSLGVYENVMKLIEERILLIHSRETAPECTGGKWAPLARPRPST